MSQDLFAAFGDITLENNGSNSYLNQQNENPAQAQQQHSDLSHIRTVESRGPLSKEEDKWDEDGEDFGDFETAGQDGFQDPATSVHDEHAHTNIDQPEVRVPPAPAQKKDKSVQSRAKAPSQISKSHPFAGIADILFDADDTIDLWEDQNFDEDDAEPEAEDEDDDEFGEFETVQPADTSRSAQQQAATQLKAGLPKSVPQQIAVIDLLGLDDEPIPTTEPLMQQSITTSTVSGTRTPKTPPVATHISLNQGNLARCDDDADAWDDFETTPAATASQVQVHPSLSTAVSISTPSTLLGDLVSTGPSSTVNPPSNIPPPSLLLTLFPPFITEISKKFLLPLAALPQDQKQSFLKTPDAHTFLRTYLVLSHILAHVIAGRKSRWKRDKHLAQSMSIAQAGRSGGMKLTGLDRSESGREDAQVEDVLRVWREQVGRLKSAVTITATAELGKLPVVPELVATMPVRIARAAEGGIASTASCALCGLKREERVAKVDVDVEDSFGEWWVEGTNMHLACRNFWDAHKDKLRGR